MKARRQRPGRPAAHRPGVARSLPVRSRCSDGYWDGQSAAQWWRAIVMSVPLRALRFHVQSCVAREAFPQWGRCFLISKELSSRTICRRRNRTHPRVL